MDYPADNLTPAPAPPFAITDEGGVFSIVIPAPRRWRLLLLLLLCAALWAVATVHAVVRFFLPLAPGRDPHWLTLPGLACWLLGLAALDALLSLWLGREVVRLDARTLTIVSEAPFYTLTRRCDLARVTNLHVAPPFAVGAAWAHWSLEYAVAWLGLASRGLAFDSDRGTHHFAVGLREDALTRLLEEVVARFPSLGERVA